MKAAFWSAKDGAGWSGLTAAEVKGAKAGSSEGVVGLVEVEWRGRRREGERYLCRRRGCR